MKKDRFLQELWTSVSLDAQLRVAEVRNPNDSLFFGNCPDVGSKLIDSLTCSTNKQEQTLRIVEGVNRAMVEERTVFLIYHSLTGEREIPVSMFIEYQNSTVQLHATAINADDRQRACAVCRTKEAIDSADEQPLREDDSHRSKDAHEQIHYRQMYENLYKELHQTKRKVEVATHDADIMLWEFDVHRQCFFSENESLTGYSKNHPITVEEYIYCLHPDDKNMTQNTIERMCTGEDFSYTFDVRITFPGSNGLQYCTFSGITYESGADGKVIRYVGSCKNNTELQRQKILQDNILNNIPIPIHIKDLEKDSRYVFCNDESIRMFDTRIGGSIYDVMNEEQVARVEKSDKEVFSTGKPYFGVERVELRDGRNYDVLVRKSVIYDGNKRMLLNVRWDQSLQNDLQRRAKVLSLSMQAMNAYTWFYDPEIDRVSFGEGFERMGRNSQRLNTRAKFASFIHPEDRQLFIDTQIRELKKESAEWLVEYRIDLEDTGNYEWWETRGIIETTLIDEIPHKFMLGMSVSIDSHKKTELELRKAKLQAEQSGKLKSAFLANMSHEIRTPLNAIVGFSDLLMNTDEYEDREDYMRIIKTNNELLLKLIGDILDLSKIESGSVELKYEEFDLSSYFENMAVSMKQRVTNPDVTLVAQNPYEECIVKLDRNRIAQILTNYVTNSIKYTPKGIIEMGYKYVNKDICFYVKDSGIGIADEKKHKVFQRFEKLDEFAQGTGLGLSICKAIAESMGGSVGFESTYGEGSLFWAILPCHPIIGTNARKK